MSCRRDWAVLAGSADISYILNTQAFLAFDDVTDAKTALNFHLRAVHTRDSTVGSIETRIRFTDPQARRKFAAFWPLVRWGSGLIRKMWLGAIKQRAEMLSPLRQ